MHCFLLLTFLTEAAASFLGLVPTAGDFPVRIGQEFPDRLQSGRFSLAMCQPISS